MSAPPIPCVFQEGAFRPIGRHLQTAHQHYGEGEIVNVVAHQERSRASHNQFFALVGDVFENLSDEQRLVWPTEDALRKHVLCKVGCCDVATHVAPSGAEAVKLTQFLRSIRAGDLIVHNGSVVTVLTAWSMSYRSMDKATFQEAKDRALPILADMIGVAPEALARAA